MQSFSRDRFTWLAYILLAYYGYFLNVFGPITPFLKSELGLSYSVSSLHYTAFAAGILVIGLVGHRVLALTGRLKALWIGAFGISLSALGLTLGRVPLITIGASFIMGLIGTLILAVVPSALSDQHGEQRAVALSEGNTLSSLVATASALFVGWAAAQFGEWRFALLIPACVPLILRLALRGIKAPAEAAPRVGKQGSLPGVYWFYWVSLMLAVSVEFCMIFWGAGYLEVVSGLAKASAAQAVSLFLGAMIVGRWSGSRLVQRYPVRRLVNLSLAIAGLGFLLFWFGGQLVIQLAGLFITGLGVAGLYPFLLSMAIASAGEQAIQASARATLASGTAIFFLPLALGRLADFAGIWWAYGIVAVLIAGTALVFGLTRPRVAGGQEPDPHPLP